MAQKQYENTVEGCKKADDVNVYESFPFPGP